MITPWGNSQMLRDRKLSPGPGVPAAEVSANQKQRLMGAMVAIVAERGYEATKIADLAELSGVSSRSFYRLFADKEACFLAALDSILEDTVSGLTQAADPATGWEEQLRDACTAFAAMVCAQPAAATVCLCEADAAGPAARRAVLRAESEIVTLAQERLSRTSLRGEMPEEVIVAQLGAMQEIARARLREGHPESFAASIPSLVELFLRCEPPPRPLRRGGRRVAPSEDGGGHDDAERALRGFALAVAEHGYAGATIHEIARHGEMSPSTFYTCFRDKQDALLAAVDGTMTQLLTVATAPYQRAGDWATGVSAAIGSMLGFLASRPAMANLVAVEVFAGGAEAVGQRAAGARSLGALLIEGEELAPELPTIAGEAIGGALTALVRRRLLDRNAAGLPSLAPIATYIALAPFVGAERACVVANGETRQRPLGYQEQNSEQLSTWPTRLALVALLTATGRTTATALTEAGIPREEVDAHLATLANMGVIEKIDPREPGEEVEWRMTKRLRLLDGEDWTNLSQVEREQFTREVYDAMHADAERALSYGTMVRRLDHHQSRIIVSVDEQGWREIGDIHRAAVAAVQEVQVRSLGRLKESGETTIQGRSMQMLFEVPENES